VRPQRMRENLNELVMAEAASMRLAERIGRSEAHARVREAVQSGRPGDYLGDLDPTTYLGSAEAFVDRALARYRESE
jgi:adenylosuccinate lyase